MRFSRKKFDNAYDRCWISVPKSDHTYKNGMDNLYIKEDILKFVRINNMRLLDNLCKDKEE